MPDEIRVLSAQLAQNPHSLAFLRLGELLRRRGTLDAAHRIAIAGLERHPHNADAHDLYARILTDKREYERAFDEWDMALRIAPRHLGALKGLAFLYFKVGDVAQAEAHLVAAQEAHAGDASIEQALAMVRGAAPPPPAPSPARKPADEPPPAAPLAEVPTPIRDDGGDESGVFAALDGTEEGMVLLDGAGRAVGGVLRDSAGVDVTEIVAAHLAGVSQEATRTARLLDLGAWTGLSAEGELAHVHLTAPVADALLTIVRDRAMPLGRLALVAQRATHAARRWLERQQ